MRRTAYLLYRHVAMFFGSENRNIIRCPMPLPRTTWEMPTLQWQRPGMEKRTASEPGSAYRNALQVCSLGHFPRQYAATQINLGNVYLTIGDSEDLAKNCLRALKASNEALKVYSLNNSPEDYAEAQEILWLAYLTLAEDECKNENCYLALEACQGETKSVHH